MKSKKLTLKIEGVAVAQSRPRFSYRDGYVRIYTAQKVMDYREIIREKALEEIKKQKWERTGGPIGVRIKEYREIPKSFSKKKYELALSGEIRPVVKPDVDNIAKAILDALNGVVWEDDKQIVNLSLEKHYSEESFVLLEVEEI